MQNYLPILSRCPLFQDLSESEITTVLSCLNAQIRQFEPSDYLFFSGDTIENVGIILQGDLEIIKENLAGDRHIVTTLHPSDIFGIVCTKARISPVTVKTKTLASILYIPYYKILSVCSHTCSFHTKIIYNMMILLGEKNYILNHKIDLLVIKGIKEKLAAFLLNMQKESGNKQFTINMNRNELAEYLNVSRPSMSRDLSSLKAEGIIDYHKNTFRILDEEKLTSYIEAH